MIEINKEELRNIIDYLELIENVLKKGGPRCRSLLNNVRNDIKYLKEKG